MNATQLQTIVSEEGAPLNIALVGSPNCGKTALFNRLTGARQKVANYAGVTVEHKEGRFVTPMGRRVAVTDLPGTYSLKTVSVDEAVTHQVLMGLRADARRPDLIICVLDATNLRLHLHLALEVRALGLPMIVALNLMDEARLRGVEIDRAALQSELGVPVIETIAIDRDGASGLVAALDQTLPQAVDAAIAGPVAADPEIEHARVVDILNAAVRAPVTLLDRDARLDRIFLHPVWGLVILFSLMFVMFQAVFAWAKPVMDLMSLAMDQLGQFSVSALPEGLIKHFISDCLFGGVGAVLVFLPQILILFAFILALEESGYLPRAAFLLDTLMARTGLSGRAFIPLLSSFACAIPGIMATRAIPDQKDRLTTIMIAPLMTCSARLPVYTLLIGAFVPARNIVWGIGLQGLVMFGLYVAGMAAAVGLAWMIKLWRGSTQETTLMMELPAYRVPRLSNLGLGLYQRAEIFLKRITGVVLSANIVLWAMTTLPVMKVAAGEPLINGSLAGVIGHVLAPVFAPIGFGWQICVALIPGLAAREIAVSALGTVYAVQGEGAELGHVLAAHWSLPSALSLLAWYVFAPQCMSTLAVIRRETGSWAWPGVAAAYLFGLAYVAAFLTYHLSGGV